MGFLMLVLLIPLTMVQSVVYERADRRNDVSGRDQREPGVRQQTIAGPGPRRAYRCTTIATRESRSRRSPRELPARGLDVQGVADTELRQRTCFKVVVYKARLKVSGRFARPEWPVDPSGASRCGTRPQ
jgi:inner membrane protein